MTAIAIGTIVRLGAAVYYYITLSDRHLRITDMSSGLHNCAVPHFTVKGDFLYPLIQLITTVHTGMQMSYINITIDSSH
jgi:hypothetical protein